MSDPNKQSSQISSEDELEELLTRPSEALIGFVTQIASPLVILGAGGKMGPTLALLAKRAAEAARHSLQIIAISRFSDATARRSLEEAGIETCDCDLLKDDLSALPNTRNVIYLVGLKFGTLQNPSLTWVMNTLVPARVASRYWNSRIVALSTANAYPLSDVKRAGAVETDPLTPLGEYGNAAVARERIFEYYSRENKTEIALLRLHYAVELRYGILVDIARMVHAGKEIPLENGYFSCIWQGDANETILRSLALTSIPASAWNLCRPEVFSVRNVALRFGELFGKRPQFTGAPAGTALLSNPTKLCSKLGTPSVTLDTMVEWIAAWVKQGGRNLEKPTHFEVRDGNY
ncbi:MAG TPA: NAD-dependent epimerase/dehydratase family protein [Verrucomicrobiae bacterium]|jgi:nucleoside-diphosphate-sugar epimerase|nr:NAD-dependent epimerase/dehydratase family protein [Verrucomicrobiae bacterium]